MKQNMTFSIDEETLDYLKKKSNMSAYLSELILKDMNKDLNLDEIVENVDLEDKETQELMQLEAKYLELWKSDRPKMNRVYLELKKTMGMHNLKFLSRKEKVKTLIECFNKGVTKV